MLEKLDKKRVKEIEAFIHDEAKFENVLVAVNRIMDKSLLGERERAVTAEDIVAELIHDALYGIRAWDNKKMPDFGGWVITQTRSKVFNIARKESCMSLLDQDEAEKSAQYESPDGGSQCDERRFVDLLKINLRGDEAASFVLEGVLNESTNQEIARDLAISVSEVVSARKRIKRQADKLRNESGLLPRAAGVKK